MPIAELASYAVYTVVYVSHRLRINLSFFYIATVQVDKYKNISKASEQRLAALEQRNKELLATVSSTATRGEICTMTYSV